MDQSTLLIASANPNLSMETTHFIAMHRGFQRAIVASLKAENAALNAKLSRLIGASPPIGVEIDIRGTNTAGNAEAAKKFDGLMRIFDAEVGKTQEREEVKKEMMKGVENIQLERSLYQWFEDTIARYKARDG